MNRPCSDLSALISLLKNHWVNFANKSDKRVFKTWKISVKQTGLSYNYWKNKKSFKSTFCFIKKIERDVVGSTAPGLILKRRKRSSSLESDRCSQISLNIFVYCNFFFSTPFKTTKKKPRWQTRRHNRVDVCAGFVDNTLLSGGDVSA